MQIALIFCLCKKLYNIILEQSCRECSSHNIIYRKYKSTFVYKWKVPDQTQQPLSKKPNNSFKVRALNPATWEGRATCNQPVQSLCDQKSPRRLGRCSSGRSAGRSKYLQSVSDSKWNQCNPETTTLSHCCPILNLVWPSCEWRVLWWKKWSMMPILLQNCPF